MISLTEISEKLDRIIELLEKIEEHVIFVASSPPPSKMTQPGSTKEEYYVPGGSTALHPFMLPGYRPEPVDTDE